MYIRRNTYCEQIRDSWIRENLSKKKKFANYLTNRSRNEFVIRCVIDLPIQRRRCVMLARNINRSLREHELLINLIIDRSNQYVFFFIYIHFLRINLQKLSDTQKFNRFIIQPFFIFIFIYHSKLIADRIQIRSNSISTLIIDVFSPAKSPFQFHRFDEQFFNQTLFYAIFIVLRDFEVSFFFIQSNFNPIFWEIIVAAFSR